MDSLNYPMITKVRVIGVLTSMHFGFKERKQNTELGIKRHDRQSNGLRGYKYQVLWKYKVGKDDIV